LLFIVVCNCQPGNVTAQVNCDNQFNHLLLMQVTQINRTNIAGLLAICLLAICLLAICLLAICLLTSSGDGNELV
jgi:hypothetical protein